MVEQSQLPPRELGQRCCHFVGCSIVALDPTMRWRGCCYMEAIFTSLAGGRRCPKHCNNMGDVLLAFWRAMLAWHSACTW